MSLVSELTSHCKSSRWGLWKIMGWFISLLTVLFETASSPWDFWSQETYTLITPSIAHHLYGAALQSISRLQLKPKPWDWPMKKWFITLVRYIHLVGNNMQHVLHGLDDLLGPPLWYYDFRFFTYPELMAISPLAIIFFSIFFVTF